MNLTIALLLTGAGAACVILITAAAVLTGAEPMAKTRQAAQPVVAAAIHADVAEPDPAAQGVIIAVSSSNYYWIEPQGRMSAIWQTPYPRSGLSADGRWQAGIDWDEDGGLLRITDLNNPQDAEDQKSLRMSIDLTGAEWAPEAPILAALDGGALYLVDPASGAATPLAERVTAYAWGAGDRLVFATNDNSGPRLWGVAGDGAPIEVAALTGAVDRFYISPERDQIVYTQDDVQGWRLLSLDPADSSITDFGNMGDLIGVLDDPRHLAPQLAVAWSPDGSRFAVGPVSEPFVIHVVRATGNWKIAYSTDFFEEGFAGELAWSPDGTQLAISTYSPGRTQHEVYVMDVAAGGPPRHLLDGCKIVWSPDGRFVAVKREPYKATGVAAIQVETGYHWSLTSLSEIVPLVWGANEGEALALATKPLPYAVQLGK